MRFSRVAIIGLFAMSFSLLGFGSSVAAQSTPAATADAATGYPVAIHQGTCDAPTAQPAWEVANTSVITASSDSIVGNKTGIAVNEATGKVDVKLDDLGNQPYVLAVHASAQDYATIVACGSIVGPKVDGKLVVALTAVGDSKVSGIAILDADTSGVLGLGNDQVQVTVYIIDTNATASATPAA